MRCLARVKKWLKPPRSERAVRAREFATRDFITIGGRTRRVTQVRHIYGGVHLTLHTGELLVLARDARYQVAPARSAPHTPITPADRPPPAPRTPSPQQDVHLTMGLTDEGRGEPTLGECWLCDTPHVPVIWLGPVQLPAHTAPLMACQPCTQRLHDRAQAYARARN